ncbi:OPT oligopeptide transporter protein-domain-containing protein [Jimgerdemannia flammicorona]|uniref:OPT oligopeptide transporter protein-domain-containing protein n=1 Tax=Jimgerdemannia flammicorona TaxID=994334 RepID=A0A433Q832_9FUNG|nr:OPT oligopeptide transporter protein-domain-containing protein [Jimgerdemannia flammicorona]
MEKYPHLSAYNDWQNKSQLSISNQPTKTAFKASTPSLNSNLAAPLRSAVSAGDNIMDTRPRRTEYLEMSEGSHIIPQLPRTPKLKDEFDFGQKEAGFFCEPLDHLEEENSPIEVVRATVSTKDNRMLPTLTFRFWVLSFFFISLGSSLNGFYYFKNLSGYYFGISFVQLASYTMGKALASWLPTREFYLFGFRFSLNPGPFSLKEHALIGIAGGIAADYPSSLDALMTMQVYYGANYGYHFAAIFVISSQLLGYGMVGFFWRYLVEPAHMIWPDTLVATAFYNTLHEHKSNFTRNLSRTTLFMLVFGFTFVYQLLPLYVMPILSSMALLCWIKPGNGILQVFGSGYSGLGLLDISLDWNAISATLNPLYIPFWSQCNFFFGFCTALWVICTSFYLTNTMSAQSYPILSSNIYNSTHHRFDPKSIMTSNGEVNEPLLQASMPMYISPFFSMVYGVSFMGLSAIVAHFFVYFLPDVLVQWRGNWKPDIHTKLMKRYKETPFMWFIILFTFSLALSTVLCTVWQGVGLPWYGLLLCVAFSILMTLPVGLVQGISGFQMGLNVLTEQICGYIFPGRPVTNMVFKTYGYNSMYQCLSYIRYGKLSHYLKIPPRVLFIVQIYASVVSAIITWITTQCILERNHSDIMASLDDPSSPWTLQSITMYYSVSVIWGAIGPTRFFGSGTPYSGLLWFYLVGIALPPLLYLLQRWQPRMEFLKFINIPIICIGVTTVPETYTNFVTVAFVIGFVFQFWLYRWKHDWWKKYNYVLAAAVDSGTQICGMAIFLFLTSPNLVFPQWWGNNNDDPEQCG